MKLMRGALIVGFIGVMLALSAHAQDEAADVEGSKDHAELTVAGHGVYRRGAPP